MQTNSSSPKVASADAADPSQPEVPLELNHRAQDPQQLLEGLIAKRNGVIVAFRAAFAAHHFDVTGYTDDDIGRAICSDGGLAESPTIHARLRRAFKRLQSRGRID